MGSTAPTPSKALREVSSHDIVILDKLKTGPYGLDEGVIFTSSSSSSDEKEVRLQHGKVGFALTPIRYPSSRSCSVACTDEASYNS